MKKRNLEWIKNNRKHFLFYIFSIILLLLTFFGTLFFLNIKIGSMLDSDMSSEMLLGKLLSEESSILSKNWYYSTELRLLNTNLFYAFFFSLISNWHDVRMLSYIAIYCGMLVIYGMLCKAFSCGKYFAITAAVLFTPFSMNYFHTILKGAYYIPHICITFMTLGLQEYYFRSNGTREKMILTALSFALALLAGGGGPRQIIILYLPLLIASLISASVEIRNSSPDAFRWLQFGTANFIGGGCGYLINSKVLSGIYHFHQWDSVKFTTFSMERFSVIINGFINSYGYWADHVFSFAVLRNSVCCGWILFTIYAIYDSVKNHDYFGSFYRLGLYTAIAAGIYILLYVFTDMQYSDRYCLPLVVLSVPLLAQYFKKREKERRGGIFAGIVLVILTIVCGYHYYMSLWFEDGTHELRKISNVLISQNYYQGYSTFWHANVLTELSDGAIEVWDWLDSGTNGENILQVTSINQIHKWLQYTTHETEYPSGKTFILLNDSEYKNLITTDFKDSTWWRCLDDMDMLYQSDSYLVFGCESYGHLISLMEGGD